MTLTSRSRARTRLAALAVVPLLLLTGCGGDDSSDDTDSDSRSSDSGGDTGDAGDVPALEGEDCSADVTLSGALEAEWSGEATVATSDGAAPPATYQSTDDGYTLTVSAIGNGFDDPTVILLADDRSFGVAFGEGTVDAAADGSGATVDAPAGDVADPSQTVQVTATFTC